MSIVLSQEEIAALTGYRLATFQLNELRKQGFYRARIGKQGVVLERGHYDAVVAGQDAARTKAQPTLRFA